MNSEEGLKQPIVYEEESQMSSKSDIQPIPNFITQVGGQMSSSFKLTIPAQQEVSREELDLNSPRPHNGEQKVPQTTLQTNHNTEDDTTPKAPWRYDALLPPQRPNKEGLKCLILDLDETLVHSSFKEVAKYDFLIPVEIDGITYQVYVAKRPGVDLFLQKMSECYELCVFTASVAKYADAVLDLLDPNKLIDWRLFRESCTCVKNTYIKDMNRMGRPLNSVMIMDNSPHSYSFNPENAIPCESWFDDEKDTELLRFIPILQSMACPSVQDVTVELDRLNINGFVRLLESIESSDIQSESSLNSESSSEDGHQ